MCVPLLMFKKVRRLDSAHFDEGYDGRSTHEEFFVMEQEVP